MSMEAFSFLMPLTSHKELETNLFFKINIIVEFTF
jgi:hypothetical protein